MAAHMLTGVLEVIGYTDYKPLDTIRDLIQPALNISCWTEQSFEAWDVMNDFCKLTVEPSDYERERKVRKALRAGLINLLPRIIKEWNEMGQPDTLEQWRKAKYG